MSDLDRLGQLGRTELRVENGVARRIQPTPAGDEEMVSFPVEELSDVRLHDLVDSTAIVANYRGQTVELIRATNRKSLALASGERRLKALVAGKPVPDSDDHPRVCPRCQRPLPEFNNVCEACLNRGQTLLRLFGFAREFKGRLIWGTILSLAGMALELVPPYLTGLMINEALKGNKITLFYQLVAAFFLIRVVLMGFQIARGRNVAFLGSKIAVNIRHRLFQKLQDLSLGFYDKRNIGSLMSRMTNDTGAIYDVLVDGIPVVVNQILLMVLIPIAMLSMNWRIGLIALIPVPIVMVVVNMFRKKMNRVWSKFWHQWSRTGSTLNGILQGTRVVKAFRGESREVDRFNRRITDLAQSGYQAESSWSTFFPFVMFSMSLSVVTVWWAGGVAVLNRTMDIGTLVAFIGYVQRLSDPLMNLQRIIDWSTRALTAAERVFEILDTPVDIKDAEDSVEMPAMKGAVTLSDVHFGYDKLRTILHGVDLEVKAGEMIGIVGHSGSGKTTLVNMIMRFYDPTQGKVEIDGIDIRKIKVDDFRRQVGVVLQESYLFPGSIKDNIAYGRPGASMKEVIAAAKAANAHDFICGFPDGYDSYVGERGQRLSGGERQRIAIARAILHNPKVLVLDEATASVDTETERMIQEAIENLVDGRTVFAIAHRLSTLRNADRLIVMDEGRIAEVGTHEELLSIEGGIYAKLVQMQSEVSKMQQNVLGGMSFEDESLDSEAECETVES